MKHLLLLSFLLLTLFSSAAISKKPNTNSLGTVQYQNNPYTYKAGALTAAAFVGDGGVVIRIQPRGTFSLYTEDILFCAGAVELVGTKRNPLVLTYETQAHHMIEGIGCHKLIYVDEIKNVKELE
jgi:hypothetical protein